MAGIQDAQHWFVLLKGKRYGPYTLAALAQGVDKGVIDRSAGVWRPGWEQWRVAGDVPELFQPEPDAVQAVADEIETAEQAETADEAEKVEEQADETARDDVQESAHEQVEAAPAGDPAEHEHANKEEPAEPAEAVAGRRDVPAAPGLRSFLAGGVPPPPDAREPDAGSLRAPHENGRSNRFGDGPDFFGRGLAKAGPARLEPAKLDFAKPDFTKPDVGIAPRRAGAPRDLLARAIPSELGAPDIGLRGPPLTDAALRNRLSTILAGVDLAPPPREDAGAKANAPEEARPEPPADDKPEGIAEAERAEPAAAEPADPAVTKPLVAVERLSDVASLPRRKAELVAERKPPEFSPAPPSPLAAAPEPEEGEEEEGVGGGGIGPVILSVIGTLIVVAALAWAAVALGLIGIEFLPKQSRVRPGNATAALQSLPAAAPAAPAAPAHGSFDGLPDVVANMPPVIALKSADPDAYGKFLARFAAASRNGVADDEALMLARMALRRSIKHLIANATAESLLEVTEVTLAYMRALEPGRPGSCVALSDESKGAPMDGNLARDFAPLFEREMEVLERIIANAGAKQTPPSEAEVRPYLEAVFAALKKKPVQTQLLARDKLTPADYTPYCDLVIAFYEGVRALPFDDAVKLLRNLYATAAAEPDKS